MGAAIIPRGYHYIVQLYSFTMDIRLYRYRATILFYGSMALLQISSSMAWATSDLKVISFLVCFADSAHKKEKEHGMLESRRLRSGIAKLVVESVSSHPGRNGFSTWKNGSCDITQWLFETFGRERSCVISQKPFLYSVRTLSERCKRRCHEGSPQSSVLSFIISRQLSKIEQKQSLQVLLIMMFIPWLNIVIEWQLQ